MEKPSSSILLFAKLIIYIQILLPHVFQSAADQYLGAVKALVRNEVDAINTIINGLKPKGAQVYVSASFCQNTGSIYGFSIDCHCTHTSGCHITGLMFNNLELSGIINEAVGDLPYLTKMDLSNNRLTGPIPDTLGSLQSLQWLQLAENKLTGNIPSTLGNLTYLETLLLPSNFLTGNLPDSFAGLQNISWFGVAGNELSGPLPLYVKNWTQVKSLIFLGNYFEGHVPAEYFQLPTLEYLLISDLNTSKTFQLPPSAKMDSIYRLILRNCSINGSIPKYISEVRELKYLDLSFNKLTGGMAEGMRSNLIYMSFARNQLTGKIPKWIFQARRARMDLSYNNFSELDAPVPLASELDLNLFACCCCKSTSNTEPYMLQPVQMMETYFHRQKPKFHNLFINCGGEQTTMDGNHYDADNETSRFHVSSLRNWAFSSSGDYFVEPENTSDFTRRLSCKISDSQSSLYDEARLSPLSLNYYGLSLYEGLYNVTLHFAEIVYTEDESDYNNLRERIFDVYIQDELVLKDFNIKEQAGELTNKAIIRTFPTHVNKATQHLLNIHLYWAGKGSYLNPPSYNGPLLSAISVKPTFNVDDGKLPPWAIALICVGSFLFVLLLFLALAWRLGWLEVKELREEIEMTGFDPKPTVKELIKATKLFSVKIGSGSLGEVYEANLRNQKVAVKKLSSHFKKRIIEIGAEIKSMTELPPHENFTSLLGVHIGKKWQLIVYQFVENKSLENVLFGSEFSPGDLKWETRLQICMDVVRGLKALHDRQKLHGNIKLTNILLDKNNRVKLSDYGMAGAYTDEDKILIIKQDAPKGIMAPEYYLKDYTRKSDIFSVGMILLIIVSGRKSEAIKPDDEELDFLLFRAETLKKEKNLTALVDKKLYGKFSEKQAMAIIEVALKCTERLPSARPEISQVLKDLDDLMTPPPAT
ncbi:hypothetical protein UlMin_012172 [Ulmus minor]